MNYEKIKEMIRRAKMDAPNKEASLLVDGFEEFISLAQTVEEADRKEKYTHAEKLEAARDRVWGLLEKTALSFGFTMDGFLRYMENATNFTPQQWLSMERVKNECVKEEKRISNSSMKRHRRNRKAIKA